MTLDHLIWIVVVIGAVMGFVYLFRDFRGSPLIMKIAMGVCGMMLGAFFFGTIAFVLCVFVFWTMQIW